MLLAQADCYHNTWSFRGFNLVKYVDVLIDAFQVEGKLRFIEHDVMERCITHVRKLLLTDLVNYLRQFQGHLCLFKLLN